MRSIRQAARAVWSLQVVVLIATGFFVVSAISPNLSIPVLASSKASSFLMPASQSAAREQSINSTNKTKLKKVSSAENIPLGIKAPATPPPPDCTAKPCIALSFDDGPSAVHTPVVLDILERQKIDASFFLVGRNVAGNEALVQRMVRDGFEIGNHSWDHPDFKKLTDAQISQEILSTQAAITAAGAPLPTMFRPPYGAVNEHIRQVVGLKTILWNEDPRDWDTNDPTTLLNAILASAKAGGVIDMHDIQAVTTQALEPAIVALKARGFEFVTISELIQAQGDQPDQPFFGLYKP